jgi:hypothetical protein
MERGEIDLQSDDPARTAMRRRGTPAASEFDGPHARIESNRTAAVTTVNSLACMRMRAHTTAISPSTSDLPCAYEDAANRPPYARGTSHTADDSTRLDSQRRNRTTRRQSRAEEEIRENKGTKHGRSMEHTKQYKYSEFVPTCKHSSIGHTHFIDLTGQPTKRHISSSMRHTCTKLIS